MSENINKRITKNTLLLYVRMILIMLVTLYTSRVILQILGVEDYGIYNLIAGFITVFAFISNSLVMAMQRFFNVALGKSDRDAYTKYFSMSINIYLLITLIILIFGETICLWFVKTQFVFPIGRENAVMWVYQMSLLTFIINIFRTPFEASIVAHEKMSFYAYISILDVFLKLSIVFLLQCFYFDKLSLYVILLSVVSLFTLLAYIIYCRRKFTECRYIKFWENDVFKQLFSFSAWTLLGQISVVIRTQGENFLINNFFGVVANAARGISQQVSSAVTMFISNFQTAFRPQLIQSYASGDIDLHKSLLFRTTKFSYYLFLVLFIPMYFNMEYILNLWLVNVPDYTIEFCKLGLISDLISTTSGSLMMSIFASGFIKKYQIYFSVLYVFSLLISYIGLRLGYPPYIVTFVSCIIQLSLLIIRLKQCIGLIKINFTQFFKQVLQPVCIVTVLSFILPLVNNHSNISMMEFIFKSLIEVFICIVFIYYIGMYKNERFFIKSMILKKIKK